MREDNLRVVCSTESGRAFIYDLLTITGAELNNYSINATENEILAGQRSVGQIILQALRRLPKRREDEPDGLTIEYMMRREAAERARREQANLKDQE